MLLKKIFLLNQKKNIKNITIKKKPLSLPFKIMVFLYENQL